MQCTGASGLYEQMIKYVQISIWRGGLGGVFVVCVWWVGGVSHEKNS